MSVCLLHPDSEAAGYCEYCAQPHCAQCLRMLLGRRYCPPCFEKVRAVAQMGSAAPVVSPSGQETGTAPRRMLPGWLSGGLYVIGMLVLMRLSGVMLSIAFLVALRLSGEPIPRGAEERVITEGIGIGMSTWTLLWLVFGWGTLLMIGIFTALMANGVERCRLADLGLRWRPTFWRDLAVGLALAGIFFVSLVGMGLARNWYVIQEVTPAPTAWLIAGLGFLILLPYAMVEEISMRGYLFRAISRSWGTKAAVVVSSLVFALIHSDNLHIWEYPPAVLGLVLAGLYLASAYLITGNLWLAIFLHVGWNLMEGPIFGLPVSGNTVPASVLRMDSVGPVLWTGGKFGPEASLWLCLLMVVHIGALWAMRPLFAGLPETDRASEDSGSPLYRAIPVSPGREG